VRLRKVLFTVALLVLLSLGVCFAFALYLAPRIMACVASAGMGCF
jgi:hypothetical protein